MALLPSSSSSSSFTYAFTYDVFLSFRGSDTRFGFTGNLHKTLSDKGIRTFIDDEDLKRGDEITPALIKAIQESRIAIPIFSMNYASSSFCLDELVTIMECVKAKDRLVFPVFYDVDPSHVRKQSGTYAEALAEHEEKFKDGKEKLKDNMERLQKWKMALNQAANLSGSHYKPRDGSYEHEFIGNIVKEVSRKINRVALPIADYLVGLESQVQQVVLLLDVGSDDKVHMVGIHGIGGIGKTTLALAVYNSIADHFEGLCFLENVRENSNKHGLLHLQKILLLAVLGEEEIETASVKQGSSIIPHRLQQKKVLLILDDVDKKEQLEHLAGSPAWFGLGSRVIITTRDKHLLACHGVKRTNKVEELNEEDAFNLLSFKAFKNDKVSLNYMDILNHVVAYASGLPLALEVIGSNLYGKSIQEWKSALQKYERIPDKNIQKILEVSFYALEEEEQSVFLDIACCFNGHIFENVKNTLNAHHDQCITYQIRVLIDKSLIKITKQGELTLHNLIEDMGKEIVRRESPKEPGNRSRLWSPKDIFEVLEENTGTSNIEMIHLDYPSSEAVDWDGEAFKKMKKLKTLIIRKTHFSKGPEHLPNSLRVIEWWKYPSQHLPSDFHPKKLSICKLPDNDLVSLEFLRSSKKFVTMKVLNLNLCGSLIEIPNISGLLNLEELSFVRCSELTAIDCSVGLLDKLKILDAEHCSKLGSFPPLKLPSLNRFKLKGCSSLENFPEVLEKMENIAHLDLGGTNISIFPHSFGNLTRLQTLEVYHLLSSRSIPMMPPKLLRLKISKGIDGGAIALIPTLLPKLNEKESSMLLPSKVKVISLFDCDVSDEYLVLVPSLFPHLRDLYLADCSITIVPECIKECHSLRMLSVYGCKRLREISEEILPRLTDLSELHEAVYIRLNMLNLEGVTIPEWFEYQKKGRSVSFWLRNNIPCILLCIVAPPPGHGLIAGTKYQRGLSGFLVNSFINGCSMAINFKIDRGYCILEKLSLNIGRKDILKENGWNHVEFRTESDLDFGFGIHVLKAKNMQDIRFTNPNKRRKIDLNLAPLEEDDVNTELTQ